MIEMKILTGTDLASFIKERQAKQVRALRQAWHIQPRLAIVTNTDNPVIETYMRLKRNYGADILIDTEIHHAEDVLATVQQLNAREDVQGIIVQLPLKDPTQTDEILAAVAPEKDVDGLNPRSSFEAATPTAINWLLSGHGIDLSKKRIAVVGYGRLVGAPLADMWRRSGLEPVVFDMGDDLARLVDFEVIVTATGSPGVISSDMVQPGAIVVDAGTASDKGKIVGDVAKEVRDRQDVSITPEKGGVGPLTVAALFDNLINACLAIANQQKQN